MREQFLEEYRSERTVRIKEANRRLAHSIRAVGLSAELMIQLARSLPGVDVTTLEEESGRTIRYLVQDHLTLYMQGSTSVRGTGLAIGATAWGDRSGIMDMVLDIDSGQLYDGRVPRARRASTEPLPDEEWFRHWRGALCAATTTKAY